MDLIELRPYPEKEMHIWLGMVFSMTTEKEVSLG